MWTSSKTFAMDSGFEKSAFMLRYSFESERGAPDREARATL